MAAHLVKLNSVLDDHAIDFQHRAPSPVDPARDRGIACVFSALEDPTFLDKLQRSAALKKAPTSLLVRLDKGVVSYLPPHASCVQHLPLLHTTYVRHGKRDVRMLARGNDVVKTFAFAAPIHAVEFVGAIDLLQHMDHLRQPRYLPDDTDPVLYKQLRATLEFATEMWTLALWQQLWPYSRLLESLTMALSLLRPSGPCPTAAELEQLRGLLDAAHDDFLPHASMHTMDDAPVLDGTKYYRASYVSLLVAKLRVLAIHVEFYTQLASCSA
ncbi:hypothetical protein ACHHYP_00001 [Achlya hypogyna]|uniref:Uncharacterized protein n=1 Tax=Achlya hypogyna TaxID=1202772 RepID=A0A1V9ZD93_ACHHY|nr:hypothetical protein ACHHYP_00001 [Achlya hypogyna]